MTDAPTCGLEGCAATAICRLRIRPRNARTLWDAAPRWVNACSGHIQNVKQSGHYMGMESLSTGEPERIVWRDEEAKA